jgi:hypothetical protein
MYMEKKERKASIVLPNLLAETLYDSITKKTYFAVFQDGKVRTEDVIKTPQGDVYPLNGESDIVSKNVVLLPSAAIPYGSSEELLNEIQTFIHKRVDISAPFERIAAQYVLLTWIYDRLNELPYLRARGDYGSGKSRFLRVVGSICYRPIFTAGATTTSPIFRILDQVHGTLILDEADLNNSDAKSDLVKILNTGYQKGTAVLRSEGNSNGSFNVRSYDVYSPKIVATRQNFDDQALESRFLIEDMGKSKLRPDISIRLDDGFDEEAKKLRNKLLMWRFLNYYTPLVFDEKPIDGLHPRLQQIIIPLLAVMPDSLMQETLIAHARRYNAELIADRSLSWESETILAILRLNESTRLDGILVKDIAAEMNRDRDWNDKDNLAPRKVGWILSSKLQMRGTRTNKGFSLSITQNQERLNFWRERLGITDEDITGEQVNIVNDVNVASNPTVEDLGFDASEIPF